MDGDFSFPLRCPAIVEQRQNVVAAGGRCVKPHCGRTALSVRNPNRL